MKHFFPLLLLALLPAALDAQQRPGPLPPPDAPAQLARTELQLNPDDDQVLVQAAPADSAVVLLIRHEAQGTRKVSYVFQHYGTGLRLRREVGTAIGEDWQVERTCTEPGVVYALFRLPAVPGRVLVAAYDLRGGQVRTQVFETKLCRQVAALKAVGGRLLATVSLADALHQTVLLLDVATGRFQFLPALYEPLNSELTSVADLPTGRAEFVAAQNNGRKQRLLLRQLSAEHGELLRSELVQTESDRSLLTAQLSPPQDTATRLLAGTYGLHDPRFAQGLFSTDLTTVPAASATAAKPKLRFYDFRHFRHAFDYLTPAHSARLLGRAERRAAREAQPLRWHYRLLLHELLPQADGGYTLIAEVYSPVYQYNSYYSGFGSPAFMSQPGYGLSNMGGYGYPGLPGYYSRTTGSNRAFLGIRTSHVLACGFDKRGNLLWDNSFVLADNIMRTEIEAAVQPMHLADGSLVLAYLADNEVHYKRISQSEASPNDSKVALETAPHAVRERSLDVLQPDMVPWVANQYVATGFQRIKAPHGPERQVFFLQALKF